MTTRGNLRDLTLSSLISINCNELSQARLRIQRNGDEAELFFASGQIVHACVGTAEGEQAVYEILTWQDGEFELEHDITPPKHSVSRSWSGLLLEGTQRLDERAVANPATSIESRGEGAEADLAARLRQLGGVSGTVLVAREGTVLAHTLAEQEDQEGAIVAFVGNAAVQVGEMLSLGAFHSAVIELGSNNARTLVLETPDYYVGLLLEERASASLVVARAAGLLKAEGN